MVEGPTYNATTVTRMEKSGLIVGLFRWRKINVQNRTNWCWVAACKVAGEQYKKNFTEFAFTLESPETEVAVSNLDGLRTDIVKRRNGIYFVDAWQSAIARNADFLHGGLEGNFPHGFKRYWRKSFVTIILFPQGSRP